MTTRPTVRTYPLFCQLREMPSHFSGVVTMMSAPMSALMSGVTSPVSSTIAQTEALGEAHVPSPSCALFDQRLEWGYEYGLHALVGAEEAQEGQLGGDGLAGLPVGAPRRMLSSVW